MSAQGQAVLTFLGGGVFGNRVEWIEAAIAKACVKLRDVGLRVVISHYGSVDQQRLALMEELAPNQNARGKITLSPLRFCDFTSRSNWTTPHRNTRWKRIGCAQSA